jgi:hypothetical protein
MGKVERDKLRDAVLAATQGAGLDHVRQLHPRPRQLESPAPPAVVLPGRQVSYAEFDAEVDRLGAAG